MKKDFNLLRSYKEYKKSTHRLSRKARRNVAIGFCLVVLSGGVIAYLFYQNQALKAKISEQESYLFEPENLRKTADVNENDAEMAKWQALNFQVQELKATAEEYPQFDSSLLEVLTPKGYTITSVSYDRGVLQVDLTCKSVDMPSAYVKALNETGLFSKVEYSGFTDTPVKYSFTVNAVVQNGKGE